MKRKFKNKLPVLGVLSLSSFMPIESKAQLPFFTGAKPPHNYALENRTMVGKNQPKFNDILVAKTFRKEIPVWGYLGRDYNNEKGLGDFFYGFGPTLNINDKFHTLATIEGSKEGFSGATFYSTINFGKNWHFDFHPKFDKKFNYNQTSFNIGKTHKGLTFGLSSYVSKNGLKDLEDTTFRVAKVKKGTFFDFGFNPKNKSFRVAFQKAFDFKKNYERASKNKGK